MVDDRETHVDVGVIFEQDVADHGVSVPGLRSSNEVGASRCKGSGAQALTTWWMGVESVMMSISFASLSPVDRAQVMWSSTSTPPSTAYKRSQNTHLSPEAQLDFLEVLDFDRF